MSDGVQADEILESQGGILVELDCGKAFRSGEDGLLHFRVRNLTKHPGRLTIALRISRVDLPCADVSIDLLPSRAHDVRFPLSSNVPGEKLVEQLDVEFVLAGRRHALTLPDHGVTLYMAPKSSGAGKIDLSNVSFDFRDHVGDVVVRSVIDEQDRRAPRRPQSNWQALALVPRASGRVVAQSPRKPGLTDLVLMGPTVPGAGGPVRAFLYARQSLGFGSKARKEGAPVPLVLRRMPCRTRDADSANIFLNDLLSGWHGSFALLGETLCLRDEGSLNGTRLAGGVIPKRTWVKLPTRFRLQLTAEADVLELGGRILRPAGPVESLTLPLLEGCVTEPSQDVGAEHANPIEALRLRRRGNAEQHIYIQVFSRAVVGSDRGCALKFRADGILPRHAEIIYYRGEWYLHPLSSEALVLVDGRAVEADEYITLAPGKTVVLGSLSFHLRRPTKNLMICL